MAFGARKDPAATGRIVAVCQDCNWRHEEKFSTDQSRDFEAPYAHAAETEHTVACELTYSYKVSPVRKEDYLAETPSVVENNFPEVPIPEHILRPLDAAFQKISPQITTLDHIHLKAMKIALAAMIHQQSEGAEKMLIEVYLKNLPEGRDSELRNMLPLVQLFMAEYTAQLKKQFEGKGPFEEEGEGE